MQKCIDNLQLIDYQPNYFYSSMNGKQLREFRAQKRMTQAQLSKISGISQATISRIEATDDEIDKQSVNAVLTKIFINEEKGGNIPPPFESNTMYIGPVPGPGEETEMTPLGNNEYGLTVPLIPVKAYAGYLDNFGDMEYYETLSKHTVTVTGYFRGRYFAFVVEGDSMENYTSEEMAKKSIPQGAIVTGREIPRQNWTSKLHLHRFQRYVIVHKEGIITKEITEHNIVEGYIICHSYNPKYPDRKIMLDDCIQILNVVTKAMPE